MTQMANPFAPLIFINGKDALAAQIFTFAHELAHIWLGSTGISNVQIGLRDYGTSCAAGIACNRIAAETLLPGFVLQQFWSDNRSSSANYQCLRRFGWLLASNRLNTAIPQLRCSADGYGRCGRLSPWVDLL